MYPYLRLHLLLKPDGSLRPALRPGRYDGEPDLTAPRLRRVLGKALIDLFCPYGEPRCQGKPPGAPPAPATQRCGGAASCPYGVLFARSRTPRPPFALYVTDGAELVELTLYGAGCAMYSWALTAIERALALGLGKRRRRWHIEHVFKVTAGGSRAKLCGHDLSRLPPTVTPETFELRLEGPSFGASTILELLSPTRFVRDGRILPPDEPVTFDLVIARLLDRFRGLYGDGASELLGLEALGELRSAAARVRLLRDATRWTDVKDYSARMNKELRLGGLVGHLRYDAAASRFVPLLRIGELLHVGKNPTSGCGRIRVGRPSGRPDQP